MYGQQSQVVSPSEQRDAEANSKTQTNPESLGTAEQRDQISSNSLSNAVLKARPTLPGGCPS